MRNPSDESKLKQKRCQGEGLDYVPWIKVNEFSSQAISTIATNWKNGRRIHLLSLSEMKVFYQLNYSPHVLDIKEQYVLDYDETCEIAKELGYRIPAQRMSTDMLVTLDNNPHTIAISIKASRNDLEKQRTKEKQEIEEEYWKRRNVVFTMAFGEDMNRTFVKNVRLCSEIYKEDLITDEVSALKYMILNHMIEIDMTKDIDFNLLLDQYFGKEMSTGEEFNRYNQRLKLNQSEAV